ncbi:MAG: M48 family metalloprotease [Kofleriaceae bacterium]|nr:M48 family metalloprotease [Kofleriaceae bacterium]
MTRLLLVIVLLGGCARTTYLGAPLPASCKSSLGACAYDLRLRAFADRFGPGRASLVAYISGVASRVARVSTLARTPKIVLVPTDGASVVGDTIVVGRELLVRLGSEAELAAILAHEIVHMEGNLPALAYDHDVDDDQRLVLESVADERGVLLLERAGYPSYAMYDALRFGLTSDEDGRHPPRDIRLRRVASLVDRSSRLDDGRTRFLTAIAGEVLDLDFERGGAVGERLVFPRSRAALSLPAGVERVSLWTSLNGSHTASLRKYSAYSMGRQMAAELVAHMRERRTVRTPVGDAQVGVAPRESKGNGSSLERVIEQARAQMWSLGPYDAVAVVEREHEAIVLVVSGNGSGPALAAWLPLLQPASDAERAAAVSARIVPTRVPRAGTTRDLATTCIDPRAVYLFENGERRLAVGDLLKCSDRRIP